MLHSTISIHSVFIGQPQVLSDEQGSWQSSIYRDLVEGPVELGVSGLRGDQVTDTKNHGRPSQAVCCHALEHYHFWSEHYGMRLRPGTVGENWTIENADEAAICVGDVYRVGTARIQVSGPRVPCWKQSRRIGRADWVNLTLEHLRTGFYVSVLTPGIVQAGDTWELEEQPYPGASIHSLNHCTYHEFKPKVAQRFLEIANLPNYWRQQLAKRLLQARESTT